MVTVNEYYPYAAMDDAFIYPFCASPRSVCKTTPQCHEKFRMVRFCFFVFVVVIVIFTFLIFIINFLPPPFGDVSSSTFVHTLNIRYINIQLI